MTLQSWSVKTPLLAGCRYGKCLPDHLMGSVVVPAVDMIPDVPASHRQGSIRGPVGHPPVVVTLKLEVWRGNTLTNAPYRLSYYVAVGSDLNNKD